MPGHQRAAKIINIGLSSWSQCPYSLDLAALLGCRLLTAVLSSLINELFFFPWLVRLLSMCSVFLSRCSQRNDSNQWYITTSHHDRGLHSSIFMLVFSYCPVSRASSRIRSWGFLFLCSLEPCSLLRTLYFSLEDDAFTKCVPVSFLVFKRLRSL